MTSICNVLVQSAWRRCLKSQGGRVFSEASGLTAEPRLGFGRLKHPTVTFEWLPLLFCLFLKTLLGSCGICVGCRSHLIAPES